MGEGQLGSQHTEQVGAGGEGKQVAIFAFFLFLAKRQGLWDPSSPKQGLNPES